jgi:2-keto-4-pentenoate hydratase/2-oxohepta-3-ene-1,7-dioic acid hydratase in catechol pathway
MRLITYRRDSTTAPALLKDGHVFPLGPLGYSDALSFISDTPKNQQSVKEQLDETGVNLLTPVSAVTLDAPLLNPGKILCIGLNYKDHATESKAVPPRFPTVFCKFPHTLIGNGEPIFLPRATEQPDYEAEFAAVIGKAGRNIPEDDWEDYIFGYTILNDVSARDVQLATPQWTLGKNFPTFAPLGPWIVTKDEIPNPHELNISLTINGETLQSSTTRELIFKRTVRSGFSRPAGASISARGRPYDQGHHSRAGIRKPGGGVRPSLGRQVELEADRSLPHRGDCP